MVEDEESFEFKKHSEGYGNVDKHYTYNNNKLTDEDKREIEDFLHLPSLRSVGLPHRKNFMELSDRLIKKNVLILFFGINPMKKVEDWKDRNIGEFDEGFKEYMEDTLKFCKTPLKYNPTRMKRKKLHKDLFFHFKKKEEMMFQGIMFMDDDDFVNPLDSGIVLN